MMDDSEGAAGTALVEGKYREDNQSFEISDKPENPAETFSKECFCCSQDEFKYLRHFHSEGRTWVRSECVGCGAICDRRVPAPGSETA